MNMPTRPVNPEAAEAVAAAIRAGAASPEAIAARLGQPNSDGLAELIAAMAVQGWFYIDDTGTHQLRDRSTLITTPHLAAAIRRAVRRGASNEAEVAAAIGRPLTPQFTLVIAQVLYESIHR